MAKKRPREEIEIDAFRLLREFDDTLEYMEKRIYHMRRKTKEIRDELIRLRPDFEGV